ncbi:hypothetical protein OF83DRAFT_1133324, partial [Amylostereum chailletii]
MQVDEPTVRIRSLKKDRVNFVLENVDLAFVHSPTPYSCIAWTFLLSAATKIFAAI